MELVLWLAGVMATWTAIKFVFMVFKRLGNKNSMNDVIDRMEDGMTDAAEKVAGYLKKQKGKRKSKEEERPIVTIR